MSHVAALYAAPDTPPPLTRPLLRSLIVAGFPSPADDYLDRDLDGHALGAGIRAGRHDGLTREPHGR